MAFDFLGLGARGGARDGHAREPEQTGRTSGPDARREGLQELGEWYLRAHGADAEPEAMEIIRRIRAAENRFRPGGKKICPYCGKLLEDEMVFCIYCGHKQTAEEAQREAPAAAAPAVTAAATAAAGTAADAGTSMFTEEEFGSMFAEDGDLSMFADESPVSAAEEAAGRPAEGVPVKEQAPVPASPAAPAAEAAAAAEQEKEQAARRKKAQGFFRAPSLEGKTEPPHPAEPAQPAADDSPEELTQPAEEPPYTEEQQIPFFGQTDDEKTPVDDSDTYFAGFVPEEKAAERRLVCDRCGSPVGPDDLFCTECGNRLK